MWWETSSYDDSTLMIVLGTLRAGYRPHAPYDDSTLMIVLGVLPLALGGIALPAQYLKVLWSGVATVVDAFDVVNL